MDVISLSGYDKAYEQNDMIKVSALSSFRGWHRHNSLNQGTSNIEMYLTVLQTPYIYFELYI